MNLAIDCLSDPCLFVRQGYFPQASAAAAHWATEAEVIGQPLLDEAALARIGSRGQGVTRQEQRAVRRRGFGWITVGVRSTTKASWRSRKSLTTTSVKDSGRSAVIAWPAS